MGYWRAGFPEGGNLRFTTAAVPEAMAGAPSSYSSSFSSSLRGWGGAEQMWEGMGPRDADMGVSTTGKGTERAMSGGALTGLDALWEATEPRARVGAKAGGALALRGEGPGRGSARSRGDSSAAAASALGASGPGAREKLAHEVEEARRAAEQARLSVAEMQSRRNPRGHSSLQIRLPWETQEDYEDGAAAALGEKRRSRRRSGRNAKRAAAEDARQESSWEDSKVPLLLGPSGLLAAAEKNAGLGSRLVSDVTPREVGHKASAAWRPVQKKMETAPTRRRQSSGASEGKVLTLSSLDPAFEPWSSASFPSSTSFSDDEVVAAWSSGDGGSGSGSWADFAPSLSPERHRVKRRGENPRDSPDTVLNVDTLDGGRLSSTVSFALKGRGLGGGGSGNFSWMLKQQPAGQAISPSKTLAGNPGPIPLSIQGGRIGLHSPNSQRTRAMQDLVSAPNGGTALFSLATLTIE